MNSKFPFVSFRLVHKLEFASLTLVNNLVYFALLCFALILITVIVTTTTTTT